MSDTARTDKWRESGRPADAEFIAQLKRENAELRRERDSLQLAAEQHRDIIKNETQRVESAERENAELRQRAERLANEAEQHLLRANQEQGKRLAAEAQLAASTKVDHAAVDAMNDLLKKAEAERDALRKDAERYRSIRLKAWLDSCVDDLVVNTPRATESEFNAGHDAMVDTEYPDAVLARQEGKDGTPR